MLKTVLQFLKNVLVLQRRPLGFLPYSWSEKGFLWKFFVQTTTTCGLISQLGAFSKGDWPMNFSLKKKKTFHFLSKKLHNG